MKQVRSYRKQSLDNLWDISFDSDWYQRNQRTEIMYAY